MDKAGQVGGLQQHATIGTEGLKAKTSSQQPKGLLIPDQEVGEGSGSAHSMGRCYALRDAANLSSGGRWKAVYNARRLRSAMTGKPVL